MNIDITSGTPYEIKGKVTLVTGIKPNTTATLINTWINNRDINTKNILYVQYYLQW